MISRVNTMQIGDEISFEVSVRDMMGDTETWTSMEECVGGHIPVIMNGVHAESGVSDRNDPMTLIGYKADGTVVMIVNDGRQQGYSEGINRRLFADLCDDLGVVSAMLLDGGGSTTLVELSDEGYELKNRPSDYYTGQSSQLERAIINAVIVSRVSEDDALVGDVNLDGKVNLADIYELKRIISEGTYSESADLDRNNSVNLADIMLLKTIIK